MPKRITAKIDTYEKDGEVRGKYVDIGVVLSGQYGEYILLNPTVDLAGVMLRQRLLDPKKAGSSVMCNIFDNDAQQNAAPSPDADLAVDDEDIPF
jgi:hypothetical protein